MTRTCGFQSFLQSDRRQDSAVLASGPTNRSVSPELALLLYGQLIAGKGKETSQWGKNHFFNKLHQDN